MISRRMIVTSYSPGFYTEWQQNLQPHLLCVIKNYLSTGVQWEQVMRGTALWENSLLQRINLQGTNSYLFNFIYNLSWAEKDTCIVPDDTIKKPWRWFELLKRTRLKSDMFPWKVIASGSTQTGSTADKNRHVVKETISNCHCIFGETYIYSKKVAIFRSARTS